MADPNIAETTIVKGKTAVLASVPTSDTTIVENLTSNSVFKINTMIISNIDGSAPYDISVSLVRNSITYKIVHTMSVPPDTSILVLSKDTSIYLQENDAIKLTASTADKLQAICSYEELL
jgi:hypothetical protein